MESNEKFTEEKLRYGELLLKKQGVMSEDEENERLSDSDRDRKNMEWLIITFRSGEFEFSVVHSIHRFHSIT
ncbi:unnamed protein product [Nippostrongylus brasiliensis]|uniref:30S ribosomal protein S15 n=1 Tax=Nippostrongylus brasiliensis TaxID=27835 RepID=A0A0N4XSK2_NIPBR|nr:unnamed protein product [Nippostrongylus brasiliensis]